MPGPFAYIGKNGAYIKIVYNVKVYQKVIYASIRLTDILNPIFTYAFTVRTAKKSKRVPGLGKLIVF